MFRIGNDNNTGVHSVLALICEKQKTTALLNDKIVMPDTLVPNPLLWEYGADVV